MSKIAHASDKTHTDRHGTRPSLAIKASLPTKESIMATPAMIRLDYITRLTHFRDDYHPEYATQEIGRQNAGLFPQIITHSART